tara:strand:- start:656 stop:2833 length:2178 start_codon:yes stop_codon:yes gene_type:complete
MVHESFAMAQSGRPMDAIARCRDLIASNPKNISAIKLLSDIFSALNDPASALGTLDCGVRENPGSAVLWLAHAKVSATLNKIDSVSGGSRRALLIAPEDSEILWFFRNFMDWSGNSSAVELLTRRALQLEPGSASVWYELGLYFRKRNRDDIGLNAFRRTALLDPAHSDAFTQISQTLCFIAEKRGQTGSLWRAPVIIEPDDGVRWGRLASFEFAVRGESRIIGEMLSVAKPELREDLTVRRILAFQAMRRGSIPEARSLMEGTFRRLSAADPSSVRHDGDYLEFLRLQLWNGDCDGVSGKLARLGRVDGPWAFDYFTLHRISDLVRSVPVAKSDIQGPPRLYISIPVWGESHTALWEKCGLQNLVDEASAPLFRDRKVTVHIFTTPDNWERLLRSESISVLRTKADIVFFDLQPLLGSDFRDRNYLAMTVAHWTTMILGRRDKADAIVLVADYIFSRGALGHLGDWIARGSHDAMYTVDLPIGERAWETLSDEARFPAGPGSADLEALADLFLENLSHRVAAYAVGPGLSSVPSDPSRLNIIGDNRVEIRTMQPQLLYASARLLSQYVPMGFKATDNGFADDVLEAGFGEDRMMLLNDPEKFICATIEFDEEARMRTGYFPKRIETAEPAEELIAQIIRSKFLKKARIWAFSNPMYVGKGAKRSSLLDDVAAKLPRIPEDLDQKFHRDVVKPAFESASSLSGPSGHALSPAPGASTQDDQKISR